MEKERSYLMTSQKKIFCQNTCQEVLITVTYAPHPFGGGLLPPVFECASYGECLVEKQEPCGAKCYDWDNCPFYDKLPNLIALAEARAS
jgi:hypothetical protein